jgi:preprotein translocase subunit SecD
MKRSWWLRFVFLVAVTVMAIVAIIPTVMDFDRDSRFPVKSKISLGLDLQGGLYMILGIDFNKVFRDEVSSYARRLETLFLDQAGIQSRPGSVNDGEANDPRMTMLFDREEDKSRARELIREFYPGFLRITGDTGNTLEFALTTSTKSQIEEQSVTKSIEVIRNRIDEFGVAEPEIVSQGKDRIIVALPGVRDIERAKDLIGQTARLEFKMVNDDFPIQTLIGWIEEARAEGITYITGETRFSDYLFALNEYLAPRLPAGHVISFERRGQRGAGDLESATPYLVEAIAPLTGEALQDARVQIDPQRNEPYVGMDFKTAGARIFEEITGDNVGRRMAVILDGNVYSAPVIQTRIGGGRAQITLGSGGFNTMMREARDLALVLRAGALPVQLDFLEQRTVGPSLGADSIASARTASLIGCALVFLFIIAYYRISGAIAMTTLALNVLFVLAALVGLEATLTLPGIAGIALTIGMAVDANIIIYERIREEVRKGVSNYKAVEGGFSQAFWTIVDANITTALAGLMLLNFGTGPIRGFAVTLLIGIFATVYTSYFVGKLIFELYMDSTEGQDLSI